MITLTIVTRDGAAHDISAAPGLSLMQAIRGEGVEELAAICGGCMSCGTCHVFIDAAHLTLLPAMSEEEDDLLAFAEDRRAESRLACQIRLRDDHFGLTAIIAPEG